MAEVKEKKTETKKDSKTVGISILLILGLLVLVIGTILLLNGNKKTTNVSLEKVLEDMKGLNSYKVELKISNGSTFTSEYIVDIDNEHKLTKLQYIDRQLVTTNYVLYTDYNNEVEYNMSEFGNITSPSVDGRSAKVSDIFDRLVSGSLLTYKDGVYTVSLSKDEVNKYNTNYYTMLKELAAINNQEDVTSSDVNYNVTVENGKVSKIEYTIGEYTLSYIFSGYNNTVVKLPNIDENGNVTDKFVDEFRQNHPELLNNE